MLITFALHNVEEIAFSAYGSAPDPRLLRRLSLTEADYSPGRMCIATAMLSAAVASATHTRANEGRSTNAATIAIAAAGALSFNASGHIIRSVIDRRYNSGLATAPFLLGASALAIHRFHAESTISAACVVTALGAGALFSIPAIVLSLRSARCISRIPIRLRQGRC